MALTELWLTSPKQLEDKHVQQIIAFAGSGKLLEGQARVDLTQHLLGEDRGTEKAEE